VSSYIPEWVHTRTIGIAGLSREGGPALIGSGQRADCTQFKAVMDKPRVPRIGPGRPRTRPDSLSMDKAYSNRATRRELRRRKIRGCIPEKTDQRGHRIKRGSAGGRPPGFDRELYRKRNTVERAINKMKQFRPESAGSGRRSVRLWPVWP
jgi:transposase